MLSKANTMVVNDILKHSKVTMPWDVYTYAEDDDQRLALDNL